MLPGNPDTEAASPARFPSSPKQRTAIGSLVLGALLVPAVALGVNLPSQAPAPQTDPTTSTGPAPAPAAPTPVTAPAPPSDDATAATPAAPVRLTVGSRGPLVRDLQRELRRRGAKITVDGAFGAGTRRAVIRQQKRLRMATTGVADEKLLSRLGIQRVRVAASTKFSRVVPSWVRMNIWPTAGHYESVFGWRWGRMHEGIDITNDTGTSIQAALPGTVSFVGWYGGYGNLVKIDHGNGLETRYAHMSAVGVKVDQVVAAGEEIGKMGATGNATGVHLHFEVRVDGVAFDPISALPPMPATVKPRL